MNTNEEFINEERINLPNGKSVAQYKLSRMNYEQKYKEALERARISRLQLLDIGEEATEIEHIFPELRESEDEKIRKEIIDYIKNSTCQVGDETYKSWIVWLEKQGEQKPTNKIEPKFKVGDTIIEKDLDEYDYETIKDIKDGRYVFTDGYNMDIDEQEGWQLVKTPANIEQNPADKAKPKFKDGDWIVYNNNLYHICNIGLQRYYDCLRIDGTVHIFSFLDIDSKSHLWTIQDAKDGDVLANKSGAIFINAGSSKGGGTLNCYCYLSVQNEFCIEEHKTGSWFYKENITPATKEQRDLLFFKMKEAGYEWDAEKKELKKIELKPAWSENAKRMFIKALERVEEQNNKGYKLTDCDKNSWWEDFKAYCGYTEMQNPAWSEKYIADVFEKVGLAKIVREQGNDQLTNALQDAMIELSKHQKPAEQNNMIEPQKSVYKSVSKEEFDKMSNFQKCLVKMIDYADYHGTVAAIKQFSCLAESVVKKNLLQENKQKPAEWSEKDENMLNRVIKILDEFGFKEFCKSSRDQDVPEDRIYYNEISWLKTLKPNHWKPSDEQMDALHDAAVYVDKSMFPYSKGILMKLYKQLKKL